MSKRVLITGAFGQLGDALIMELQPHFKLCATGKEVPQDNLRLCKYTELDITKKKSISNCIHNFSPDVVVHLACMTNVDGCEKNKEESWGVNVTGTEYIINAVR